MEKIALITGSSRGIGRAVARELGRQGWRVCINYRVRQDCAESLAAELAAEGHEAMIYQADVSRRQEVQAMVRAIEEKWGPVSLLVNNAGVAGQALFQDVTDEMWHRYFSTNVDGAYHTIQAVLPAMLHAHEGCIINISSIWGQRGASCEVTYCIAPGVIKTDMLDALPPEVLPQLAEETPLRRLGTPEDIAHAAAFLASEKADFITGQVLTVDGGFIL